MGALSIFLRAVSAPAMAFGARLAGVGDTGWLGKLTSSPAMVDLHLSLLVVRPMAVASAVACLFLS